MSMVFVGLSSFAVILLSHSLATMGTINSLLQLILFTVVACIPGWKTGRLSYVDIAWPWGLACIGALTLALSTGDPKRALIIGIVYLMIGLRMGLGALVLLKKGFLRRELPRYQYRRMKWEEEKVKNIRLETQIEILKQCVANISFSALFTSSLISFSRFSLFLSTSFNIFSLALLK